MNTFSYNQQGQGSKFDNNYGGLKPSYRYKQPRIIWLNSFYATSTNASGNTTYSLTFNLPPFQLFNQTSLKVVSYISNESTAKPIIIKIDGLNYDVNSTYNSDKEAFPTLYVNHTAVASQQYNNYFSMTLLPQQVSTITLYLNNTFTARNQGFTINTSNGAGHFILGLMFEEADLQIDNGVSQYK